MANDDGLDNTPLTLAIVSSADNGDVTLNAEDNTFTYESDDAFTGSDSFIYSVTDDEGASDSATVTITVSAPPAEGEVPLEGYGTSSTFGGGAGFETCTVTNLNNSGNGSFRDCATNRNGPTDNPTPRTVVFEVGGTITLTSDLHIRQPYITIDGLTAPEPGITFAKSGNGVDGGVTISTWPGEGTCGHDVLIQGIRSVGVWDGDTEDTSNNATTFGLDGEDLTRCLNNVVANRITVTNAQDSAGDIWGSATNVTYQYSAFLMNLHPSTISHSPGGEANQERERISLHHNLFALFHERGPQIRGNNLDFNFEQNIIHKWSDYGFGGGYGTRFRCRDGVCPQRINVIENHWTSGGQGLQTAIIIGESSGSGGDYNTIAPEVYMSGNVLPISNNDEGNAPSEFSRTAEANVTLYNDNQLVSDVLPFIGAPYRTEREQQIFDEVETRITQELE